MRIFIKLVIMLILIPLTSGYLIAIYNIIITLANSYKKNWHFLLGILAGIIFFPLLNKRRFIRTFEHEMTHLLFAKLFFGKIKELNVNAEGEGYVEYTAYPNPFIRLSPYFFPLFSAVIAILIPLLNPTFSKYFFIATGFFLINHLFSSTAEIFSLQPDIKQEGIVFSLIFISFFLIFIYGIIISEVISTQHIIKFLKEGLTKSISNLILLKDWLHSITPISSLAR
ncbi:MAG: M50 family metallopeptidase [Deltaproteobacteria bacterium]|nr:M50 family metallopeptidase [Deltaproteobacteria bacterium]